MPSSSRSRSRRPGRRPPPKKRPAPKAAKAAPRAARPAPSKRKSAPKRSWAWRHRKALFLVVLGGFTLLAGAAYVYFRLPLPKDVPPAQTTFLYDVHGKRLASLDTGQTRVAVPLNKVPKVLVDAVLSSEDRNFYKHGGIDPVGIIRATWADVRNRGTVQGGSTITQQYVKNTYLGQERTFTRKLKEAALAVKIQRKLSKDQILERYLNTVYFGRHAYGVQAAARAYYLKDVGQLNLNESAYLAGLIRAPELAQPERNMQLALTRRHLVLQAMEHNHKITAAQRSAVEASPLGVKDATLQDPEVVGENTAGTRYFVDYVRRQLVGMFGEAALYSGGYRVKTSLDPTTQKEAYDAVYGFLKPGEPHGALVAIDDHGLVRAMVGGRGYDDSKVNLAVGKAGGGSGRQAGSTFKPFLLAETVKEGYSVESALPGPAKVILPKADVGPNGPRDWTVTNFDNEDFGSKVNLIDATRNSVNTVYAQLVVAIGADKLKQMAEALGVKTPLQAVNAMVLGSESVSVMDMAGAFSTFANLGTRVDPRTILEVDGPDGKVIRKFDEKRTPGILNAKQAATVNFCLQQVVQRGTGVGANIGKPMIGKTGTTENFGDAWFVGATRKMTAAVWMGFPEGASHTMDNVRGIHVNGGSFPATIFKRFMSAAEKGVDPGTFPSPNGFSGTLLKGVKALFSTSTTTPTGSSTTVVGGTSTTLKSSSSTTVPGPAPTSTLPPPPPTTAPPHNGGGGGGQDTTTTTPRRRNNSP